MRHHLRVFVNSHMKWIAKVGMNILRKKGLDINDYVNDLVELVIPLDQLGLLILARTYHCHITVWKTPVFHLAVMLTKGNIPPNKYGTELPVKEDLNVDNSTVLPQSDADNREYPPNKDGAEIHGKEHLDVDNKSVLPQSTENLNVENTSVLPESDADQGEYSSNEDGTELPAKEDLDVDNYSVLPQTCSDYGESPPTKMALNDLLQSIFVLKTTVFYLKLRVIRGKLPPMQWTYSYVIKKILLQT